MSIRAILGMAALLLAEQALADRQQQYLQAAFRVMAEDCQRAVDGVPGHAFPKPDIRDLQGCYSEKVRRSFAEAKNEHGLNLNFYGTYLRITDFSYGRDRQRMLMAAMQADPKLALVAYDAALRGRLNPLTAFRVAARLQPEQREQFARHSIERGADPSQVLAATAAGNR